MLLCQFASQTLNKNLDACYNKAKQERKGFLVTLSYSNTTPKLAPRWGWWVFTTAVILWLLAMTLRPDRTPNGINLTPLAEHSRAMACLLDPGCLFQCHAFWFLFIDVAGNIAVFLPFGFGLALAWRRSIVRVALAGLGLSLVIELLQLVIPSRATDIDDLIFNTLGAALGALGAASFFQKVFSTNRPAPINTARPGDKTL